MKSPDRTRWGNPDNYLPHWAIRSQAAAELIPDGCSLLEIGVGAGEFRNLVQDRCSYTGADLEPWDDTVLSINLDSDPLPDEQFDYIVLLGVFEYLYEIKSAVSKICAASSNIVCSYCCLPTGTKLSKAAKPRKAAGWVNHYTLDKFIDLFSKNGFIVKSQSVYSSGMYYHQVLIHFEKL